MVVLGIKFLTHEFEGYIYTIPSPFGMNQKWESALAEFLGDSTGAMNRLRFHILQTPSGLFPPYCLWLSISGLQAGLLPQLHREALGRSSLLSVRGQPEEGAMQVPTVTRGQNRMGNFVNYRV